MKGVLHDVYPMSDGVHMANNDDDHYVQVFQNWDEVNAFIAKVQSAAKKAFGPDYSDPAYDE